MPEGMARQRAMARAAAVSSNVAGVRPVAEGLAEIPLDGALQEAQVLDHHGVVEAHDLAEARDLLGRGVGRQQEQRRGPREVEDEEDHGGDAQQHQERLEEAPDEEGVHRPGLRVGPIVYSAVNTNQPGADPWPPRKRSESWTATTPRSGWRPSASPTARSRSATRSGSTATPPTSRRRWTRFSSSTSRSSVPSAGARWR